MARGPWPAGLYLALALAGAAAVASAADWGGITPGVSTLETVRDRYGPPSRETRQQVEGYGTVRWIYEGTKAPVGMKRMTVEFGLLTPSGFRPNAVRFFKLEPHPEVFSKRVIVNGWGVPDRVGERDGREVFSYDAGLLVSFDGKTGQTLEMTFALPQVAPAPAAR